MGATSELPQIQPSTTHIQVDTPTTAKTSIPSNPGLRQEHKKILLKSWQSIGGTYIGSGLSSPLGCCQEGGVSVPLFCMYLATSETKARANRLLLNPEDPHPYPAKISWFNETRMLAAVRA
ncbi:hypothetical protein JTE90_013592 [Oedothorax gibbosus]|uniref:Uncharacterized protein n=1 Tax=Oedothorax gibbosus TaxID=931172 RepID=A0AAV6VEJ0_9ARAC|nr:hypothetical protein JTE90_013592 [Oedothorax gibbosus]